MNIRALGLGNSMMISFDDYVRGKGYVSPAEYIHVNDYVDLKLFGQSGGRAGLGAVPYEELRVNRPKIAVLQYGSNEIASLMGARQAALNVLRVARELMREGVEVVEILSILPRLENLRLPPAVFEQRALDFRFWVRRCTGFGEKIYLHLHKGFVEREVNGWKVPVDMNEWSWDGIHPNKEYGRYLYARSLRNALFHALTKLH